MRLLIMGAPGAGKGTQSTKLAQRYGVPAISTGDIFRHHIKNETELGLTVKALIERGEYVPDELTEHIVVDRLAEPDAANGFLLDGFPRTLHQAHFLDEHLDSLGHALDAVVSLEVKPDELVARIMERSSVEGRLDDTETTVRRRMEVYAGQTAPLLSYYDDRGILVSVDGSGTLDEVRAGMNAALDAHIEQAAQMRARWGR